MFIPGVHICGGKAPPIVHVVFLNARRRLIVTGIKVDGPVVLDNCGISGEQMPDDRIAGLRHG
jgi:hypothetical protein